LTSTGSKSLPGKRLEKLTCNKITDPEITVEITAKQQQRAQTEEESVAAAALVAELIAHDLNRVDAVRFAREKPEECRRQLTYLAYRTGEFRTGKGAYLRRAIEDGFAPPKAYRDAQAREEEARKKAAAARQQKTRSDRKARFQAAYQDYLLDFERELAERHPAAYSELQEALEAEMSKARKFRTDPDSLVLKNWLNSLEKGQGRLEHLMRVCRQHGIPLLSFEQWDDRHNPYASERTEDHRA
jgi:hypothetical protein